LTLKFTPENETEYQSASKTVTVQVFPARGCYEVHASCLNMLAIMRQAKAM
jgi:hypothetical protein